MKFEDLNKQERLLMYLNGYYVTIGECADEIINYGITKNRRSLSTMLNSLAHKGYVENVKHFYAGWCLTDYGQLVVDGIMSELEGPLPWDDPTDDESVNDDYDGNDDYGDDKEEQTCTCNDAMKTAFESMAKSFEAMAKSFEALSMNFA